MESTVRLAIRDIRRDGGTQMRAELSEEVIEEYTELLRQGVQFPPVVVVRDPEENLWLADGFHRLAAAERAYWTHFPAEVFGGSVREARLYAIKANARHGLRRTNADKRKAVLVLLEDEEWRQWSDVRLAEAAAVSDRFVARIRAALSSNDSTIGTQRIVERGGQAYVMHVRQREPVEPLSVRVLQSSPREGTETVPVQASLREGAETGWVAVPTPEPSRRQPLFTPGRDWKDWHVLEVTEKLRQLPEEEQERAGRLFRTTTAAEEAIRRLNRLLQMPPDLRTGIYERIESGDRETAEPAWAALGGWSPRADDRLSDLQECVNYLRENIGRRSDAPDSLIREALKTVQEAIRLIRRQDREQVEVSQALAAPAATPGEKDRIQHLELGDSPEG
jgi:hypothetical protein